MSTPERDSDDADDADRNRSGGSPEQSDRGVITVLLDLLGAAVVLGWRPGCATRVRVRIGDLVADQAAHSDGETTSR